MKYLPEVRCKVATFFYKKQFFYSIFFITFALDNIDIMIQRIQTIYLLIIVLINSIVLFLFPIDFITNIGMGIVAGLALISIFLFKNRKKQFVLNRINILCNLIILGVLVYWKLNSSGEVEISEKGVLVLVPLISIVFLFMANRAIRRDEQLVKSADRLR